jgi:predicted MFS family arabinose efflux permease
VLSRVVSPYARLLREPHFARMVLSAGAAFLPFGMLPLALVLFARDATGSYAKAGIVVAAANLGRAVLSPGRGRSVDRRGPARVLPALGVAYVASMAAFVGAASAGAGVVVLSLLAIAVGATPPPVNATLRSVWTPLIPEGEMQTAYSVHTLIQECSFLVSPLLTALVVGLASPAAALWISSVGMLVATLVFASSPPVRARKGSEVRHSAFSVLRAPQMRVLLATVVCFAGCFGALDIAAPAFADAHGNRALGGVLLAAVSIGVLAGTIVYGTRRPGRSAASRYPGSCALAAAGLALMLLGMSIPDMAAWMLVAGLALAPATTCGFLVLAEVADANRMTEATAWFSTAASVGLSVGALVGGLAVDGLGPRGGIAAAVLGGALAWAVAQARRGTLARSAA